MHRYIIGLTGICEANCNRNGTEIIMHFSKYHSWLFTLDVFGYNCKNQ